MQPGIDPSRRHPNHAPERPGGSRRAQQRGTPRHRHLGQGGRRAWDYQRAIADNLGQYTQALLEIARQPGQRSERDRLLREETATALHRWAVNVAPHTLSPEQTPVITEYGGTTFRSQLEARWAAWFDKRGMAWEYEPARFDGWTPDFRLALNDGEAYAEVKPVSEFPMDVAQRMLNSGWTGDILILGQGPRHAWRYHGDGWSPVDLAA